MKAPIVTVLAAVTLLGAAGLALLHSADSEEATASTRTLRSDRGPDEAFDPAPPLEPGTESVLPPLPPNHPPISGAASPHEAAGGVVGTPDDSPAITWTVPAGWTAVPNPNAMRIATYRPAPDAELIVARAGGTTDANIQRWIGQFDEPARTRRTRKVVHGLSVEEIEASGTYSGGGMVPGTPSKPHPGWTLVGAVVETPGSYYFFKLIGPSNHVQAVHASFDALIESIRPLGQ